MSDKFYIERPHRDPFVCEAETPIQAIAWMWTRAIADGDTDFIMSAYLVHHGREEEADVVFAAPAYWELWSEIRPDITKAVRENRPAAYQEFCKLIVQHAPEF